MSDTRVVYGLGGYDPAAPNDNVITAEPVTLPPETANRRTIERQAADALAANRTFIAKGATNTAADVRAQTIALSRQVNALIRLQLADLSGTD